MVNVKEMIAAVRSLALPGNQIAVCGSAVLLAHGLVPYVRDIDIIAYGDAWETAGSFGRPRRAPNGDSVVTLRDGLIEIYDGWSSMDWRIRDLVAEADAIDGIKYVRPSRILEYKKMLNRPQDQGHIALLEGYLAAQRATKPPASGSDEMVEGHPIGEEK